MYCIICRCNLSIFFSTQASSAVESSQNPRERVTTSQQRNESQSKALPVPTKASVASTPVIKSSKSASKITVGFQEESEPSAMSTPISSKATEQQENVSNDSKPDTTLSSSKKSYKNENTPSKKSEQGKNTKHGASTNTLDESLRSAVESMGLDGDKDLIQSSVDAVKSSQALPTTPKSSK